MNSLPEAVASAVQRARQLPREQAWPPLVELARSGDARQVWCAALAQLAPLWWWGRSADAGDVAERVVTRFGEQALATDLPSADEFALAVIAAEVFDGVPASPRLARMRARVPREHPLWAELEGAEQRLARLGAVGCLPIVLDEPQPLFEHDAKLARKSPTRLSAADSDRLWIQAASCGQQELMLNLFDAGIMPPRSLVHPYWALAQTLGAHGRTESARDVLRAARSLWVPLDAWQVMPQAPVVVLGLRQLIDSSVAHDYLTLPLAEGWH